MPMANNFENQELKTAKIFTCYIITKTKHLTEWVEEIKTEQKEKNSLKYME